MKEAFGNAFVVQFVIIFVIIFILFFVGGLSYTKAFKVKNRIVNIIEENDGYTKSANEETSIVLKEIGYRVSKKTNCEKTRFSEKGELINTKIKNYNFCVYKFNNNEKPYYGVVTFMYFDVPIIGAKLEFPVYGETRILSEEY